MGNEGWKTLFLSLRLPTVRKMLLTKMLIETRDSWSHCRWWCKPEHGYLKPEAGKQPSVMPRFMLKPWKRGNWIKKGDSTSAVSVPSDSWCESGMEQLWGRPGCQRTSLPACDLLEENHSGLHLHAFIKKKKGMMLVCSLRQEFVFNYTL